MLNTFKLCSVHAKSDEVEKWSILSTKEDYVEYKRKELPTKSVKFNPTEVIYHKE